MKNHLLIVAVFATILFSSCEQFGSKATSSDSTSVDTSFVDTSFVDTLAVRPDTVILSDTISVTDTTTQVRKLDSLYR